MDALHATAMFFGIAFHTGIAYMVPLPRMSWPWSARHNLAFDVGYIWLHSFRMPLFFMVCGFFARLLLRRLGVRRFIDHRVRRIALPLALGVVTVAPLANMVVRYTLVKSWPESFSWMFAHFIGGPDHLWFLYYLLIYYVASLLITLPLHRSSAELGKTRLDREFVRLVRSRGSVVALACVTSVPVVFTSTGLAVDTPTSSWKPVVSIVVYYGLFYLFGWLLHRSKHLLHELKRGWQGYAIVAFGLLVAVLILEWLQLPPRRTLTSWSKLAAAIVYSGLVWSSVFTFLTLTLQYADRPSRLTRYYADASYWFYLVHLPVVLFLQTQLNASSLNPFAQFSLTLIGTLLFCLITYHFGVRFTWVGTLLNGRRERLAKTPQPISHGVTVCVR